MTKQPKYINLSRAAVVGTLALIAVVVGPAQAHKTPVTAQQLQAYQEAFLAEVKKGDLLFHGQAQMGKFATLRDMINWCIEKPNQGEKIDSDSEAMKALEAYIYWSNTGSVLVPGKY